MPITQASMIAQMQEARAAHQYGRKLRNQLLAMLSVASRRYPDDTKVQEILTTFIYHLRNSEPPDDRVTWMNEHHYRRRAKQNDETRERQEIMRRMAGVPTKEEAMAILLAKNELRRANLPATPSDYILPQIQAAPKTGPRIQMPRDYPDDSPLEFDSIPYPTTPGSESQEENLFTGPKISLDLSEEPCYSPPDNEEKS
jgi:hypothetical protein